jgi:flagellar biosynthesis protein FlhB
MSQQSVQPSLESQNPQDHLHRFFGGPPLHVIGRLVLLSILVGVILAAIGLDPWNIIESVQRLLQHIWNWGFDTVRWLWRYFLLGAVIVVPIWLLTSVAKVPRGL